MKRFGINDLRLLEALFDQLPASPFFVKDARLRYVAANHAMAQLCGASHPQALHGRRAEDFFPPDLARRYEALDEQVLREGRSITNLLERSIAFDGETAWLLFARVPVRGADGSTIGVAATSRRLPSTGLSEAAYERLRTISDRIRREFDRPLRLGELARQVGTSPSQLERDFRRVFAMTPRQFLHDVRMSEASRLLIATDRSVAAIAQDCGYSDHSAFTRRFVTLAGVSPSAYRVREKLPVPSATAQAGDPGLCRC